MSYFPMYVDFSGKKCLVAGGGPVAFRKAETLYEFGAEILVVSPGILPEIQEIPGISCRRKQFEEEDLCGREIVVAATDDAALNHRISQACKERGIFVNAVDQKEDCSFIFPAYLKEGEVVAAFSSGGQSPAVAQYLKEQMRPVLTPYLGSLTLCLGGVRETVRQCTKTEAERKSIYKEILSLGLKTGEIPSEQEIFSIIRNYQS